MENHISDHLSRIHDMTHDFVTHMDPNTDPSKIFALYFYYEGSNKQYKEMQTEIIDQLRADEKNKIGEQIRLEKYIRKKRKH
jgi:hypothetical protein